MDHNVKYKQELITKHIIHQTRVTRDMIAGIETLFRILKYNV